MRWLLGQKFLADNYNEWRETYTWYLEIEDYDSQNNDGEIEVEVELTKYDGDENALTTITVPHEALEDEVDLGALEPVDRLRESQKTDEPEQDEADSDSIIERLRS